MSSLTKLSELAKDTSKSGRKSFVGALTELFVSDEPDRTEQVSLIFGDIVLKVLGQLEDETRQALAKRVSDHTDTPRNLAVELAKDKFDIAEPMLENSPVLTSDDLVDIASSASMEHLGAIAGRDRVDQSVTRVLVDRGDSDVLTKVAENEGALFDQGSFLQLVERARALPEIQAALVDRKDLPSDAARELIPFLSKELSERIKSFGADHTIVQVMAERAAEEVAARARRVSENQEQSDAMIRDVQSGKADIDDAIRTFAHSDRAAELGILLAKVSKLPNAAVSGLIFSSSDKPLIILCRASGVSDGAFKDILTMRARRLRITGAELNDAIQRYASLKKTAALRSLETIRQSAEQAMNKKNGKEPPAQGDIPFAAHR